MTTGETESEIEQYLGQVPSWMAGLSPHAMDHSWGMVRDLELGETDLSRREKELVGLGAAAAMQCPYCTEFHTQGAKLEGVPEAEVTEAVNIAANTRYFSTILHGHGVDYDEFVTETGEIVAHIEEQQAATGDD